MLLESHRCWRIRLCLLPMPVRYRLISTSLVWTTHLLNPVRRPLACSASLVHTLQSVNRATTSVLRSLLTESAKRYKTQPEKLCPAVHRCAQETEEMCPTIARLEATLRTGARRAHSPVSVIDAPFFDPESLALPR